MSRALRRRLTLERLAATQDGAGGRNEAWEPIAALYAQLVPVGGRETLSGGRSASRMTHKAYVRHQSFGAPSRPKADQRFREDNRIFAIRAVSEADEHRGYLVCWLEEGAPS